MATSIKSIGYTPGPVPNDPKLLPEYIGTELRRIAAVQNQLAAGHVDQQHAAPARPRTGDIRLADGSDWEPGSGQGPYMYYNGVWNPLGAISTPTTFRAPLTTSAPVGPTNGDIILADGAGFDPGSGAGFYGYYASAWHFLG